MNALTKTTDRFIKPITYGAAHARVRAARGRADLHVCADCGRRAQQWSYEGGCEFEQSGSVSFTWGASSQLRWSPDPDMYSARCRRCHSIHDYGRTDMADPGPFDPADVNLEIFDAAMERGDKVRATLAINRIISTTRSTS
ncbi:hypothetical protein [Microbacterium sp.]|uniref:hypothetical protein n=1 Tax=Microbacterium sp. TaxID=51671 RepID=UPI0035696CE8